MKRIILLIISLFAAVNLAEAQYDCKSFYKEIQDLYLQSHYQEVIEYSEKMLRRCNYSKEEKIKILEYSAASKAILTSYSPEEDLKKLLRLDPNHKFEGNAGEILQNLALRYKPYPAFTIAYQAGAGQNFVDIVTLYQLSDSVDYSLPYYSTPSSNTALTMAYSLSPAFSLGISGGFFYSNYAKTIRAYNFLDIEYKERFSGLNGSMFIMYKYNSFLGRKSKVIPYIKAGVHSWYNTRIRYEIQMAVNDPDKYADFTLPKVYEKHDDLPLNSRRQFRYGVNGSFGVIYKMEGKNLFFEGTFMHDLQTYTLPESRIIPELAYQFLYINDDIIINRAQIMLGISFDFKYKIKKIKR